MLVVLAMGCLSAADVLTAKKKSKPLPLNAFHINLSWECMALPPFGSGIYAATHCKAGKFKVEPAVEPADTQSIPAWEPDATTQAFVPSTWQENNKLVTSCTHTFLLKMQEWNKKQFDVITMVEMANPGIEGFEHLGRTNNTLPQSVKDAGVQQVDPKIYEVLKSVLKGYEVFGNVIKGANIATQATYWNPETLKDLTFGVGFNTVSADDRPGSALFFGTTQTLVLNIHGIHFRRNLNSRGPGNKDPITVFGKAGGKTILDMASGAEGFGLEEFNTDQLQKLYGDWLTAKISDALDDCKELYDIFDVVDDVKQLYCQGTQTTDFFEDKKEDGKLVLKPSWKIIVAGDFNDETMELSKFKVFNVEVSVEPKDRKRTTSSDMDKDFQAAFKGSTECDLFDDRSKVEMNGVEIPVHTTKTADYLESGGYKGYYKWLQKNPKHNPMRLPSAPRKLQNGNKQDARDNIGFTGYPFPSDMILGSANLVGGPIVFPFEYTQKMSTKGNKGYKPAPIMPGCEGKDGAAQYADGMISDHDPIQRTFAIKTDA